MTGCFHRSRTWDNILRMADYYPLIARAIAGLDPGAPGESRHALYERARTALLAQLRSVQPPLTVSEVTRERLALEEAIRKIESETAALMRNQYKDARRPAEDDGRDRDPLAELARIIGQTDPFGAMGRAEPEQDYEPSPVHPLHRYPVRRQLDPPLREEAAYSQPAASEEVEGQRGLENGKASRPNPKLLLPPISTLPEQNEKKAIAFRPSRRGPLELLPDSALDSAKDFLDPEQSQLYARMRTQLIKLREDIPSQERIQIDDALNDFLDQPTSWQAVEFKKVLWLCGNALRSKLAQHDAVRDSPDPHYSALPEGVAAALRRPVETWNVFVLGDADLVELDLKRLGPQEQQTAIQNINAVKPIVETAAIDRHITTEQTGYVLTASLRADPRRLDSEALG
jgi:hypothetical protein